ncbi:hypothetical protein Efla_005359 [Eimeria flavescens]
MLLVLSLLLALSVNTRNAAAVANAGEPPAALNSMLQMHEAFDDVLNSLFDGPADVVVGTKVSFTARSSKGERTRKLHVVSARRAADSPPDTEPGKGIARVADLNCIEEVTRVQNGTIVVVLTCFERSYAPTIGKIFAKGPFKNQLVEVNGPKLPAALPQKQSQVFPTKKCSEPFNLALEARRAHIQIRLDVLQHARQKTIAAMRGAAADAPQPAARVGGVAGD